MLRWTAIPALLLLGSGCSGISTTQSVSPATFLLPGLLQADPPPPQPASPGAIPADEPETKIAQS
jgi:hypothetical protein